MRVGEGGVDATECGSSCRPDAGAATAEVDTGSASSRGRPPERIWMVRLRRRDNSVIVAVGLHRFAAEHLAARINDLLAPQTVAVD
jgi:hypothetical protein